MSSKNVRIGSEAHSLLFSVYPRIRLPGREAYRSTFPSALMPWCLNKHSGKSSCSLPLFIQTLELRFAWSFHKILITFYLLAVPLLTQRRLQVTNYQTVGQPRAPLDGHVENRVCVCVCVWVWYRRVASSCGIQTAIAEPHVAQFRETPTGVQETYCSNLYL